MLPTLPSLGPCPWTTGRSAASAVAAASPAAAAAAAAATRRGAAPRACASGRRCDSTGREQACIVVRTGADCPGAGPAAVPQHWCAARRRGAGAGSREGRSCVCVSAGSAAGGGGRADVAAVPVPTSYDSMLRQATQAVKAALVDGHEIIEVDFPVSGLWAVAGDGEGQNEMNASLKYLRQFLNAFRDDATTTRVFFPDDNEMAVARSGQSSDPAAGRSQVDPLFGDGNKFQLGYLTKQNAAWAMFGVNLDKWTPTSLIQESDRLLVVAYPTFNPKEELGATLDLYQNKARDAKIPILIFNGELDRIKSSGYYSPIFFPKISEIAKELVPKVRPAFSKITTAYYVKNFKGSRPGVLFRCYPGPWTVLRRNPADKDETRVIWTGSEAPSLRQVQLEILASDA